MVLWDTTEGLEIIKLLFKSLWVNLVTPANMFIPSLMKVHI